MARRVTVRRSGSGRNGAPAGPLGGPGGDPVAAARCPSPVSPVTRKVVDSGTGRDMAGKAGGGARARQGWAGLGVTFYFIRRVQPVTSFLLCVFLYLYLLIVVVVLEIIVNSYTYFLSSSNNKRSFQVVLIFQRFLTIHIGIYLL